jgi:hypothetical protein
LHHREHHPERSRHLAHRDAAANALDHRTTTLFDRCSGLPLRRVFDSPRPSPFCEAYSLRAGVRVDATATLHDLGATPAHIEVTSQCCHSADLAMLSLAAIAGSPVGNRSCVYFVSPF